MVTSLTNKCLFSTNQLHQRAQSLYQSIWGQAIVKKINPDNKSYKMSIIQEERINHGKNNM